MSLWIDVHQPAQPVAHKQEFVNLAFVKAIRINSGGGPNMGSVIADGPEGRAIAVLFSGPIEHCYRVMSLIRSQMQTAGRFIGPF
jgi:hypothetical protein